MNMLATIDLGGTHCRFARFAVTAHGLALEAVETCPTARLQDGSAVLAQWEKLPAYPHCLRSPRWSWALPGLCRMVCAPV